MDLLAKLKAGGQTTFVQELTSGVRSDNGLCRVFWTSNQVNATQVTFDDLLTPLVLALALGKGEGEDGSTTVGEIRDYRLGGVCTDVWVGFTL